MTRNWVKNAQVKCCSTSKQWTHCDYTDPANLSFVERSTFIILCPHLGGYNFYIIYTHTNIMCTIKYSHNYHTAPQTPDIPPSLTSSLAAEDTHSICSDNGGSHLALPVSVNIPRSSSSAGGLAKVGQVQFTHILQKDCFLVFRSLCKLSMKGISDIHDSKLVLSLSPSLSLSLSLSLSFSLPFSHSPLFHLSQIP